MTDNDIIKALECCILYKQICSENCPLRDVKSCKENLRKHCLDLINRQKAEIEKWKEESSDKERAYTDEYCLRKEWQTKCQELLKDKQTAKSEAIEEFAERLKHSFFDNGYESPDVDFDYFVDNLLKEMVGENNAE